MQKHHTFLWKVFSNTKGYKNKRLINASSLAEIRLLLSVLYCISQGHIDLRKAHYKQLIKSKRRNSLVNLKQKYRRLLNGPREPLARYLTQFASLYQYLLSTIFE